MKRELPLRATAVVFLQSPPRRLPTALLTARESMHPWIQELLSLQLPSQDYALFGSGPLLARGWIESVGDLDVVARGAAWRRAQSLGRRVYLEDHRVHIVTIGEHITVGDRWAIGQMSVDPMIDQAEWVSGVPCVPLRYVIEYKRLANRARDREHLDVIERHIGREHSPDPTSGSCL